MKQRHFRPSLLMLLMFASTARSDYKLEVVAEGFEYPWCIAFLPDGEMLVTERRGRLLRIASDGQVSKPISGVPDVFVRGQGGLFDVLPHPNYESNRLVYLSYAHGGAKANATRVARARLDGNALRDLDVVFTIRPSKNTAQHYGGKMAFLPDGSLLLTSGDGFDFREQAQNTASLIGKVVRIEADGSIPDNNPFVAKAGADPAVWTYGHRNAQGMVVDPLTGTVYLHEHGPRGGDEINVLVAGSNYGWPAVTHGVNYSGAQVSPYRELPGMVDPIKVWIPSIAPSGFAIYRGEKFPDWDGDLFVGALVDRELRHLDMLDGRVVGEQALFSELGERIRDVRLGPDGLLYLVTDSKSGKILRVSPK